MALKLQQKLLIASISLFPIAGLGMLYDAHQAYDQSNDLQLPTLASYLLVAIGMLGILLCALIWKWPDP